MTSASRSCGRDEKQILRSQPLREYELLGIPRSVKKNLMNMSTIKKPKMQPVRIKGLFGSSEIKKSTRTIFSRRTTMMANVTSNIKKKLCDESAKDPTWLATSNDDNFADGHSPARGEKTSGNQHLLGQSKSDGKVNKPSGLGRERMQPENMKDVLKSWENCQTVQPSASKSRTLEMRNEKVRRKLYSVLEFSPMMSKSNNKLTTQSKLKSQKTVIIESKSTKSEVQKCPKPTISKLTRKSCLLPPNSIRNKYVNLQHEGKMNESLKLEHESKTVDCAKIQNDENINLNGEDKICETANSSNLKNINESMEILKLLEFNETKKSNNVLSDMKNSEEERTKKEISRPTVIMRRSIVRKELQNESNDIEKLPIPISRLPLQELNKNSSLIQQKSAQIETSFDDLLANNIHREFDGSYYCENLPQNYFLESTTMNDSLVKVDRRTLTWLHGNLKQNVQTIEEQLFSMKKLLKAVEDVMENDDDIVVKESKSNIDNCLSPALVIFVDTKIIDKAKTKNGEENIIDQLNADGSLEIPLENNRLNDDSLKTPLEDDRLKADNSLGIPLEESIINDSKNDRENSIFDNNNDQDKENCQSIEQSRRRSLRLAKKFSDSSKHSDDSFSRIEQELNIVHIKERNDAPSAVKQKKSLDPRSRRSVREYMALKSTIKFLATPDIKGFPTPKGEKDTPSHSRIIRRSLSRKLLTELDDLYAESPI